MKLVFLIAIALIRFGRLTALELQLLVNVQTIVLPSIEKRQSHIIDWKTLI